MNISVYSWISVCAALVGFAGFAAAKSPAPTKGRIPNEAYEGSDINIDKVPDYIVAYSRDGSECGYVHKRDLFAELSPAGVSERRLVVVDDTLTKVVGHMVSGRGFVPLGKSDDQIPRFEKIEEPTPNEGP